MKLPKIKLTTQKPNYLKIAEDLDFFEIFQKVEQETENCFLFESLGEEGKFSRYSILGFDPVHKITAKGKRLIIDNVPFVFDNPYYALREILPERTINTLYAGGLVGYLSYDATNYFERAISIKQHTQFPSFSFGVYADGLIVDKVTNELFYFFYDDNREKYIKDVIKKEIKETKVQIKYKGESTNKKEHEKIVKLVKDQVQEGKIFQCEVGVKTLYTIQGNNLQIYKKLREINPSPFMYYLKSGEQKIIGASPELLFSLNNGEMTTKPLAGTINRGKNEKEDKKLARLLLNNEKELAEHRMLIDLQRNDIGRVAKFGTVKIKDPITIKKFSHVQHISSEITGQIKPEEDMFSGVAANFPAGTVTGAPKIEAMKVIENNETEARGPYAGGIGYFGFNGDCEFAIAIRSLFINNTDAYSQTSSGIVYDSTPENEYKEIQRKFEAMKKTLMQA